MVRFTLPLAAALIIPACAFSATPETLTCPRSGVQWDVEKTIADQVLPFYGSGQLRAARFLHVYAAALYAPTEVPPENILTPETPRWLEIYYERNIPARIMIERGTEALKNNISTAEFKRLLPRIEKMHDLFEDAVKGDRFSLAYSPSRGTEVRLNGQLVGRVDGGDFASAYFTIWLGEQPASMTVRNQIFEPQRNRPKGNAS